MDCQVIFLFKKMLRTSSKIFITGSGQTQTHEGCRQTPFTFQIHVDHALFEDKFFYFNQFCGGVYLQETTHVTKSFNCVLLLSFSNKISGITGFALTRISSSHLCSTELMWTQGHIESYGANEKCRKIMSYKSGKGRSDLFLRIVRWN